VTYDQYYIRDEPLSIICANCRDSEGDYLGIRKFGQEDSYPSLKEIVGVVDIHEQLHHG
jgi:hypothetical protein